MILDLTTITASVRDKLVTPAEKADGNRINRAINDCLDDLTDRLVSMSLMTSDTDTIAASTRTHTLVGAASDLRYLFLVKYGTGDSQKALDYVDAEEFVRKYDNPAASAGVPTKFTILGADAGDPILKFDKPTQSSDTLTYYYFPDLTSNNLSNLRSGSTVILGSLAWFYGPADGDKGQNYHLLYMEKVKRMRASDHYLSRSKPKVGMNTFERGVNEIRGNIRNRR